MYILDTRYVLLDRRRTLLEVGIIVWMHLLTNFGVSLSFGFGVVESKIQTRLCSGKCQMLFPVDFLFGEFTEAPRSFCCTPDFCYRSCLRP